METAPPSVIPSPHRHPEHPTVIPSLSRDLYGNVVLFYLPPPQGSRKSQRAKHCEIFGKRRSGARMRALPLGAMRERSRLLRRGKVDGGEADRRMRVNHAFGNTRPNTPPSSRACRGISMEVLSLLFLEILRLRFAPLRMTRAHPASPHPPLRGTFPAEGEGL